MARKNRTKAEKLTTTERRLRTVDLRRSGQTYQQLGEQLGVSRQTAYRYVARALDDLLKKIKESTEALVQLELKRLDYLLLKLAPKIKAGSESAILAA